MRPCLGILLLDVAVEKLHVFMIQKKFPHKHRSQARVFCQLEDSQKAFPLVAIGLQHGEGEVAWAGIIERREGRMSTEKRRSRAMVSSPIRPPSSFFHRCPM